MSICSTFHQKHIYIQKRNDTLVYACSSPTPGADIREMRLEKSIFLDTCTFIWVQELAHLCPPLFTLVSLFHLCLLLLAVVFSWPFHPLISFNACLYQHVPSCSCQCLLILPYANPCSPMLDYANLCSPMLDYANLCSPMLDYANPCSPMLDYANPCYTPLCQPMPSYAPL